MHIEVLRNENGFLTLQDEWDALVEISMTNTPFQRWAYQRAWWQHLGVGELYILVGRDEEKRIVGMAPLFLKEGVFHFNGCVEETDYLDLIAQTEEAEAVWEAVFDWLGSNEAPDWQGLDFCNVPANSPTRTILPRLCDSRGFSLGSMVQEVCPIISLPNSFDDYLSSLPKKQRHETKRKMRRANGAGARLHIVTQEDDVPTMVDDFLNLLQQSTPEKQAWLNEGRRALFHDTTQATLDAGILQLMFLMVEEKKAAALYNFAYRDQIWVYNSGLDPENFGWLGAGVVLTAMAVEYAIEQGFKSFDFLRGDEEYKYQFGAVDSEIYRLQVTL